MKGSSATPANDVSWSGEGPAASGGGAPDATVASKGKAAAGSIPDPFWLEPVLLFCCSSDCNQGNDPSSVGDVCSSSPLASRLNSGVSNPGSVFSATWSSWATTEAY